MDLFKYKKKREEKSKSSLSKYLGIAGIGLGLLGMTYAGVKGYKNYYSPPVQDIPYETYKPSSSLDNFIRRPDITLTAEELGQSTKFNENDQYLVDTLFD